MRDAFIDAGHQAILCDLRETERPGPHHQGDVMEIINEGWDLMVAHPPCTYLANSGVWALHEDNDRWQDLIDGAVFFRELWEADIPKIAVENPVMHKYAKKIIGCGDQDQTIQPYQFGHPESKRTCLWLKNLPQLEPRDIVSPDGWKFVKYAGDCGKCEMCGEPYCFECDENYADCNHLGPTEERLNYNEIEGRLVASDTQEKLNWNNQTDTGQDDKINISDSEERAKARSKTYQGIAQAMADQWG